ncbi:hypothetical protein [Sorangium sp. So ce1151]|uniref:hypothetical protein n=1 Tax=Sorangium sp. So ce1151 TaxID=3133332 RepID=UPI003F5EF9C3
MMPSDVEELFRLVETTLRRQRHVLDTLIGRLQLSAVCHVVLSSGRRWCGLSGFVPHSGPRDKSESFAQLCLRWSPQIDEQQESTMRSLAAPLVAPPAGSGL